MQSKNLAEFIENAREALEQCHSCIGIFDLQGNLLYGNSSFERMWGISLDSCLGQPVESFFLTGFQGVWETLKSGQQAVSSSILPNGVCGYTYRKPLFDSAGNLIGVFAETIATTSNQQKYYALQELLNSLDFSTPVIVETQNIPSGQPLSFDDLIGESQSMRRLKAMGRRLAQTGTGKELFAHAVHRASRRKDGPFVAINCAAIPHDLIEAELFGYMANAFTNANRFGAKGKFELAAGGTIFLDEIGEFPLDMQPKLLRVLEKKEILAFHLNLKLQVIQSPYLN